MRKILFIMAALTITFSSCNKGKQYIINGTITGIKNGKAFLQGYEHGDWVKTDSAEIKGGKFVFKGKLKLPELRYLVIDSVKDQFPFFVENSKITLKVNKDSMDRTIVTGSVTQMEYMDFMSQTAEIDTKEKVSYESYKKAKKEGNLADIKKYDSISTTYDKQKGALMKEFAAKNPRSVVGAYLIWANEWQFELSDIEMVISRIDTSINNSVYVIGIKDRIEVLKPVAVGQVAPDFSLPDSLGKIISLASFRGKLVLVDFWASWCSPCRAENPSFVAIFKEFHKKGFQMLGVSLDEHRDKWLKAISDDKLAWNHVSDLKGWKCAAGKLYGINSIPSNVLIAPDGKIIARNVFGDELRNKLKELLK